MDDDTPKVQQAASSKAQGMPETIDITLHENDHIPPIGLFISHNGRTFILKPGEKVTVPRVVKTVLDDAIISQPVVNPDTRQVEGYRSMPRYPYTQHTAG